MGKKGGRRRSGHWPGWMWFAKATLAGARRSGGRRRGWCGATMRMNRKTMNLRSGANLKGTVVSFAREGS
jgi:hypothetical protein